MNRLSPSLSPKGRIRPRTAILSGATLGLLAGAAVFGSVSSSSAIASSPTPLKPALVSASTPNTLAPCAKGQTLEHGVCIVHVERTIVAATGSTSSDSGGSSSGSSGSEASEHADEAAEHASEATREAAEHADETAREAAEHASETARESAEHAGEAAHETESHS
ncbi:MAG TPA: hypothetical protein VES02_12305 [Dermatophilaceae bacterium]|nr:hypothetical protein [Dermatophilaceae bacterium]